MLEQCLATSGLVLTPASHRPATLATIASSSHEAAMMPAARCARTMRARRKRKKQQQSRVLLYSTIHNLGWLLETQLRKQNLFISVDRPVDVGRAVQLYDVYSSTCMIQVPCCKTRVRLYALWKVEIVFGGLIWDCGTCMKSS